MINKNLNEWLEDRNKVAISGKYEDYEKFCKKYNIPQCPNNEVYEIMLHKIRANITKGIPKEMQEESRLWLLENGYKTW